MKVLALDFGRARTGVAVSDPTGTIARLGDVARDAPPVEVTALAYDNRRGRPGTLFFCVPGEKVDGHEFAAAAVDAFRDTLISPTRSAAK